MATAPKTVVAENDSPEICSIPPTMIIPLIALVTLINGVWSAGVTFQMTCHPTKHAKTKTVKCEIKLDGAETPIPVNAKTPTITRMTLPNLLKTEGFGGSERTATVFWASRKCERNPEQVFPAAELFLHFR